MDVHHQTSAGSFAQIDSERATIAMRLVMMCGEFIKAGEPQKALEAYHHARDILDGLASSQPHNLDLGLTLSLLHLKIGDLMRARGDLGEAKEAYRSSLAIAERLATFHPDNEELQRNQAEAHSALSTMSGTFGFGPKLDCAIKRLEGFPSLHEALASGTHSRVEAPAPAATDEVSRVESLVVERPRELQLRVRERTAPGDLTGGGLIHNIPRKMRVGALEKVEVRIPRRQGTDAITVRLRAPEGRFLIFPLSAETSWTDGTKDEGNDYATWRWNVTPQRRGRARLHISAQTLDAHGMAAEAALPDQVLKVFVRVNYARALRKVSGWGLLMVAGAALSTWGPAALHAAGRLWGLLERWPL
jgi:hypothetical protein